MFYLFIVWGSEVLGIYTEIGYRKKVNIRSNNSFYRLPHTTIMCSLAI